MFGPGAPGGPPPGFDPNSIYSLPQPVGQNAGSGNTQPFNPMPNTVPFNPGALNRPGIGAFNGGQPPPGFDPNALTALGGAPSLPSFNVPGFIPQGPPTGPYAGMANMLINGQPVYGGGPLSQQAYQDWLRMILLGMTALEGR